VISPLAFLSGALLVTASIAAQAARYVLSTPKLSRTGVIMLLLAATAAVACSLAIEVAGHWQSGLRPHASGYAAMVYMAGFLQAELVLALLVMALFVSARVLAGRVDAVRRNTVDNTAILLHYTVAQGLLGLLLVHGFPRLVT
jgi:cytochrome c oxidase subunit I+III